MARSIIVIALCTVLSACSAHTGSLCPIGAFIPDAGAEDRWTENEKDQLTVLNETGEAVCGWKAPSA